MSNIEQSKFHVYSIGIVAKDKPEGSFNIEVVAIESNNLFNGNLDETDKEKDIKTNDRNDTSVPKSSKTSQTLTAEWIGIGSGGNRATAPDVRQGEKVIIYRYADEDKYFWECIYTEHTLRRLERVMHLYGGNPVGPGAENNSTNSYWSLISTLDKLLQLHTSDSNGEPFVWDIKLDTGAGVLTISDNNSITITINASEQKVTHDTGDTEEFNNKTTIVRSSTVVDLNTVTIDPDGNVYIPGNLIIGGGLSTGATGSGKASINGDIEANGDISNTGSISAAGEVHGSNIP